MPSSPIQVCASDVRVIVDFDGTIVPGDVTDHILGSFAGPEWLKLEALWQSGQMSSRECLAAQVDLIRASREDIVRAINEREIDPSFAEFVTECAVRKIPVTVVSDGFDLAIETVLARHNLDLPYYSNRLEELGDGRWRLAFPHRNPDCDTEAGNCKCRQVAAAPVRTVVIGDGRSDFCAASRASFVLSKSSLTAHCEKVGLRHWPVAGFAEVVARFDGWLAEARAGTVPAPKPMRLVASAPAHATSSTKPAYRPKVMTR